VHRSCPDVGNEAGYVTALNEATGSVVWSASLGSAVRATQLVENGYVWVARTFGATSYKLDAATGATVCSAQLSSTAEGVRIRPSGLTPRPGCRSLNKR
jgi:outer membrane protein assembly factor BamB